MQQKDESNETPDAFTVSHSHSVAVAADFKINKFKKTLKLVQDDIFQVS